MRVKGKWSKGEMARTIVIYLLRLLTMVLIWACALKTIAVLIAVGHNPELGTSVDLSDVLGYAGAQQSQNWACWLSREYSQKRTNR
jgi:hypothetical protein